MGLTRWQQKHKLSLLYSTTNNHGIREGKLAGGQKKLASSSPYGVEYLLRW